ncbi:Membrane protein involved in the export of O-antigen and teichoic acid [Sphingomonas gellani]|uniref:Membrane protein involved in the export of O-antigen and teichoic acid n=1 Tax=Sphingomonas gellani TaxID=1166340 RepID=A0A1H8DU67_9SPHN|nr:oligosaccharide flippase family protein [Sphingomonas gellani]SEN10414.1 Membrane protein involved in the export of O-antigen and teichoic acid [Sphingomonas gellani]
MTLLPSTSVPHSPFVRALRNVGWLLTGKGFGAVLSLIYLALATRSLGVKGFGEFSLILGTGQTVSVLVGFQTWQLVVRFGMSHLQNADEPALARLIRACLLLDAGAALVGCVLAAPTILLMQWRFQWSAGVAWEALVFCLVLLLSIRSTMVGVLRLHDRFAAGAVADAVTPLVRFVGALVAVWAGADVTGFLVAWAVGEVLTAIGYWWSARRYLTPTPGRWNMHRAMAENAGWWRFAWQSNLNSTLNASSKQLLVVLVGFVVGAAAAGGYRLANQLAQALVRVSEMFARGVFPEVTRAHGSSNEDLSSLRRLSVRLALGAGLVTCLLVPALGSPALRLIAGHRYLDAYPLLVLLGMGAGLDIMATGFEPILLGMGHADVVLRIRVLAAVLMFAAIVPLMAWAGTIGAGVAVLLSSLIALVMLARASGGRTGAAALPGERAPVR